MKGGSLKKAKYNKPLYETSNSYTVVCSLVWRDNPRTLASGLTSGQVDKPMYNYFILHA